MYSLFHNVDIRERQDIFRKTVKTKEGEHEQTRSCQQRVYKRSTGSHGSSTKYVETGILISSLFEQNFGRVVFRTMATNAPA